MCTSIPVNMSVGTERKTEYVEKNLKNDKKQGFFFPKQQFCVV